jgi:pSer/pThr/pTyr-binding forkhead associated (FHA) protein
VANYRGQSRLGLVDFRESGEFIIVVEEQRLSITLAQGAVATIGRADHGYVPELDLSAFRGRELGVSRQHAMFHHENDLLFIIDLDSANGTMLGGIPLSPQQRRIIRDGDEIRLGKLRFHIYFE